MSNRERTHSADKPAGGIKGEIPQTEGAVGPGAVKGAGGAMPADVETEMPWSERNQLDADAVGGRAGEPDET